MQDFIRFDLPPFFLGWRGFDTLESEGLLFDAFSKLVSSVAGEPVVSDEEVSRGNVQVSLRLEREGMAVKER